jgi:hypothetical protein
MSCEACNCAIGQICNIQGNCIDCGSSMTMLGEYVGMEDNYHKFEFHPPFPCPGCKALRFYSFKPCEGLDVTKEFNEMFLRKESHWLGKNARG